MQAPHARAERWAEQDLSRVFKALASDTRRGMLDALRVGPLSTGELVMHFPVLTRFAVMQHLKVLVKSGLVLTRKDGRVRYYFLNVMPIQMLYERWVSRYEGMWAGALTDLKSRAEGGSARRGADHPPSPGDVRHLRGGRA